MTTTTDTCWADPLSLSERRLMAVKLATAAKRFWEVADPESVRRGGLGNLLLKASAEMADLHLDVTERAEVAERQDADDDADRIIERMNLFTGPDDLLGLKG